MKIYEKFYVICYCVLNAEFMNVAPSRHLVSFHFYCFITVFIAQSLRIILWSTYFIWTPGNNRLQ